MSTDASLPQGISFSLVEGSNDMGDEKVVELLVRGFFDQCLGAFQGVLEGQRDLDDAVADIGVQAETLNALFLGTSPIADVTLHPWNHPDQLGVYIRDALGLDFPPDQSVKAAFVHVATLLMRVLQGNRDGWEKEAEDMRLDLRDLLLGRQALDGGAGDGDMPGL